MGLFDDIDKAKDLLRGIIDNIDDLSVAEERLTGLIDSIKDRDLLIKLFDNINVPIPVATGNLIAITRTDNGDSGGGLAGPWIKWYGAACYHIGVGKTSVLTDPFITYYDIHDLNLSHLGSKKIESDLDLVRAAFNSFTNLPEAIFVGHSHYDHLMDAVEMMELDDRWDGVHIYGSRTTKNIVAGYEKRRRPGARWSDNCVEVELNSQGWKEIKPPDGGIGLYYKSYEAKHAPHACVGPIKINLWDGPQKDPRTTPPKSVKDYPAGETLIYLFKFSGQHDGNPVDFTAALVGAATPLPHPFHDDPVDVLILCVPGSQHYQDYPMNLIRTLNPRVILLSHYDDFFKPRGNDFLESHNDDKMFTVLTSNFFSFLYEIQNKIDGSPEFSRFEKILVPGIGAEILI